MSLSSPVKRKLIHTREVRCHGFEREDGLWDIEGRITDTKTYSFENIDHGEVNAGAPVHDMVVRLTVDEELLIHDAEASTISAPFFICPATNNGVKALVGLKIASGWTKNVHKAIGSVKGCTHINQLLIGPLATTAYQSIFPKKKHSNTDTNSNKDKRPALMDTCHAFAEDGDNAKRLWPNYYKQKNN